MLQTVEQGIGLIIASLDIYTNFIKCLKLKIALHHFFQSICFSGAFRARLVDNLTGVGRSFILLCTSINKCSKVSLILPTLSVTLLLMQTFAHT